MKVPANRNYHFILLMMITLLTSCGSHVFTNKKFHLDLVKVEKKQIEKPLPKKVIIIPEKSIEVISTSNENQFILSSSESQNLTEDSDLKLNQDIINSLRTKSYTKKLLNVFDSIQVKKAKDEPKVKTSAVKWDWVSILSIISGLIAAGLLFGLALSELILLWIFLSLLALILGAIGLSRTKKGKRKGRGFAIAGLILGIAQVIFLILLVVFFFLYFFSSY